MVQQGARAGKISKPYGLQGEVHIILNPLAAKHIKDGIPLFIELDGQRVPFFIDHAEIVSADQAILKFEFIGDLEAARKICGSEVFFDEAHPGFERELSEAEKVVGYLVVDSRKGELGIIEDFLPSEFNPMWTIRYGTEELMIPASHDFILRTNHRKRILYLDLPEGLTEL
jgi:16S rRNA processing protein RimM